MIILDASEKNNLKLAINLVEGRIYRFTDKKGKLIIEKLALNFVMGEIYGY